MQHQQRRPQLPEGEIKMAIVFFTGAPSRDAYEQISAIVESDGKPEGLIVHTATEQADGMVRIVDVWESQEAVDAFGQKLMGAFAQLGLTDEAAAHPPEVLQPFRVL